MTTDTPTPPPPPDVDSEMFTDEVMATVKPADREPNWDAMKGSSPSTATPRYDLIHPNALDQVALAYGAEADGPRKANPNANIFYNEAMALITQHRQGVTDVGGLHPLAHAIQRLSVILATAIDK